MNAVGLFSGGKDSLYAVYLAQRRGVKVDYLLTVIPSLPWPSPHTENITALKTLAGSMHKEHVIVDLKEEGIFHKVLKKLKVEGLVAGDVFVEEHYKSLSKVCEIVGLELIEPLYGLDTKQLFKQIFSLNFECVITGVNLKHMSDEWLGFIINKKTCNSFLSENKNIDPLGENGEYHTLTIGSPLYNRCFKVAASKKKIEKKTAYLKLLII